MRTLMMIQMEPATANRAIKDGTLPKLLEQMLGEMRPEAAYFTALNGRRTALIFFDLAEEWRIPTYAEPFFQALNADITFAPAMSAGDVQRGISAVAS